VIYIVARSLAQGRRSGLASVAGVALGNLGNAAGASLGLAALFAVSSLAFAAVKWAGAAYLLWLGGQMLRSAWRPAGRTTTRSRTTQARPATSPLR
jgi:threonine/homoserine/homoserine lactone efflux protein